MMKQSKKEFMPAVQLLAEGSQFGGLFSTERGSITLATHTFKGISFDMSGLRVFNSEKTRNDLVNHLNYFDQYFGGWLYNWYPIIHKKIEQGNYPLSDFKMDIKDMLNCCFDDLSQMISKNLAYYYPPCKRRIDSNLIYGHTDTSNLYFESMHHKFVIPLISHYIINNDVLIERPRAFALEMLMYISGECSFSKMIPFLSKKIEYQIKKYVDSKSFKWDFLKKAPLDITTKEVLDHIILHGVHRYDFKTNISSLNYSLIHSDLNIRQAVFALNAVKK